MFWLKLKVQKVPPTPDSNAWHAYVHLAVRGYDDVLLSHQCVSPIELKEALDALSREIDQLRKEAANLKWDE